MSGRSRILWFGGIAVATVVVLCLLVLIGFLFNVLGLNTHEVGWRFGTLTKYSDRATFGLTWLIPGIGLVIAVLVVGAGIFTKRLTPKTGLIWGGSISSLMLVLIWLLSFSTYEGQMFLGTQESANAISTVNDKPFSINPSYFSSSEAIFKKFGQLVGRDVALHYRKKRWWTRFSGATDTVVDAFQELSHGTLPDGCNGGFHTGLIDRAKGYRAGRVVEVARVGWRRTREILIHQGGSSFLSMSTTSPEMYQCLQMAGFTGKKYRFLYEDRIVYDPLTTGTTYNIVGVLPIDEGK